MKCLFIQVEDHVLNWRLYTTKCIHTCLRKTFLVFLVKKSRVALTSETIQSNAADLQEILDEVGIGNHVHLNIAEQ